ncbi:MAG: alpha/beta fold hydrolase [Candidatus Chisholmbacteria bacterium]|nr:alpha/beta fold hydrolase [Candidatus Chisholmbacteria bacterium]
MKTISIIIGIVIVAALGFTAYWFYQSNQSFDFVSPVTEKIEAVQKPLLKYTFENLATITPEKSQINIEEVIDEEDSFTARVFAYISEGKRITGQINVPEGDVPENGFPVILMLRGFIDPETCSTGDGTRSAAAVFAQNGFVTIAPDFPGCGGSDDPDENSIVARLKHPYEVLVLLNSLDSIPYTLDTSRLFIWGHSNGGQMALSLLEVLGKPIPTTLWAPVSKPFPYSILYYTDEFDDRGKALRKVLADFERDYDVDLYSIDKYYDRIKSPIQIHQGTADDAVPKEWTDALVKMLEEKEVDVTYYLYPGSDHNLRPAWDTVISRDVAFFRKFL